MRTEGGLPGGDDPEEMDGPLRQAPMGRPNLKERGDAPNAFSITWLDGDSPVDTSRASWRNTTHDWAGAVDRDHLSGIRRNPHTFAPGGTWHLILEVVAYAADEAECGNGGRCRVTLHADGSVSVADDGRGTDTRSDEHGQAVKKPVMATKDLRFFDSPEAQMLPDGHPRRGMSVVAALSEWLVHTNRRRNGSWTQRYEHGAPATGLEPVADDGTTGTVVHFRPGERMRGAGRLPGDVTRLATAWPHLAVDVRC